LEVADIFRRHGPAWRAANEGHLSPAQRRVMRAIELCRTAELGGHVEQCADCAHTRIAYNSCRNRHCPKCQWTAAQAWLAAREAELLPVPYFHLVFTLPAALGALAYQNKAKLYGLLLKAAADTLTAIAADPKHLGPKIGVTAVLHTWGQTLDHHPHVHCIVPAGGIRYHRGAVLSGPAWQGRMSDVPQVLLAHHLKALKLPTFLREHDKLARQCAAEGVDHSTYLLHLAELELLDRERRMVERRIRQARFPAVKSLDSFDFIALPSLNKMLVLELARGAYVERRENVIALGNSGTGKTHVALGLGLAACQKGFAVGFTTAAALVHELLEARDERRPAEPVSSKQRSLALAETASHASFLAIGSTAMDVHAPKLFVIRRDPCHGGPRRARDPRAAKRRHAPDPARHRRRPRFAACQGQGRAHPDAPGRHRPAGRGQAQVHPGAITRAGPGLSRGTSVFSA
jgi:hypothetical protein